jgi:hypothetical protein
MKQFICYDKESGRIISFGECPDSTEHVDSYDVGYIDHAYSGETHVENGILVTRRLPDEILMSQLRAKRDKLLAETDWTQLPDIPVVARNMWTEYRQQLRDLPATCKDLANPEWPQPTMRTNGETG